MLNNLFSSFNPDPDRQVDVWLFDLSSTAYDKQGLRSILSADELDRADRFKLPDHRHRFTQARANLRCLLGQYLNRDPDKVKFDYGPKGKPSLPDEALYFNVSHSKHFEAIGVTRLGNLGIDLESEARIKNPQSFAPICLSPVEQEEFDALQIENRSALENLRRDYLIKRWTLKEAYLKATGIGLTLGLHRLQLRPEHVDSISLLLDGIVVDWHFHFESLQNEFVLASAVESKKNESPANVIIHSTL